MGYALITNSLDCPISTMELISSFYKGTFFRQPAPQLWRLILITFSLFIISLLPPFSHQRRRPRCRCRHRRLVPSRPPEGRTRGHHGRNLLGRGDRGIGGVGAAGGNAGNRYTSTLVCLQTKSKPPFSGWYGLFLIVLFTVNACYSGTRLGECWVILEERFPEFKGIIRDPYPTIGEKAAGKLGRLVSLVCICLTLYGGGCVFIVLIAQLIG